MSKEKRIVVWRVIKIIYHFFAVVSILTWASIILPKILNAWFKWDYQTPVTLFVGTSIAIYGIYWLRYNDK